MADTYPIKYKFTRCIDNGSSTTYTNDFTTYSLLKAKAVDGCTFVENDGDNNFCEYNNGSQHVAFNIEKVSSSDDQKVIDGEITTPIGDVKSVRDMSSSELF